MIPFRAGEAHAAGADILNMPGRAAPPDDPSDETAVRIRRRVAIGMAMVAALTAGVGGWAATAKLSGAIIAAGLVVIDSNVKRIQHPTGGVIGELAVKNGMTVRAGAMVARLDDVQTRAGLGIVMSQLIELRARKARLEAEFKGQNEILFPDHLLKLGADAAKAVAGEARLFDIRRTQQAAQVGQLKERVGQLKREIEGLGAQHSAKRDELALIRREEARVALLYKRGLVPETRMLAIKRDRTRIAGEVGVLTAQMARAGGQVSETELQILTLHQTVRSEAQRDLRDLEGRIAELSERRVAAEDQLKRTDIRAPIDGVVHEMAVHTVGGVVSPGETLMLIVPSGDLLKIEVRLAPTDIDQVSLGQRAVLRFPAFNQRTTPEIPGTISRIAADLSRDPQTGATYYVARISAEEAALGSLGGMKLVPGMPVEAFIETAERTALSYILKPVTDQLARAFKEE
jgi:HlyD family secretion protein